MPRSTASAGQLGTDRNTTGSTGTADRTGSSAGTGSADRAGSMGRTSSADRTGSATGTGSTADRAGSMDHTASADHSGYGTGELASSGSWDKSCFISSNTDSFAFQTSDGRVMQFDTESNDKIKKQLDSTSRVTNKNKIFRVKVEGSDESGKIHLKNITM